MMRANLKEQLRNAVTVEGKVSRPKLLAKLIITLVAAVWVIVYLGVMLTLGTPLLDYFRSQDASDSTVSLVSIWFLFTIIVSAIYFMYRIYRSVIGEWTKRSDDSDSETDTPKSE